MNGTRRYYYIASFIVCLGIGLRLIGLDKGLWLDETYVIDIARSNDFFQSLRANDYPPAYFLLLRLWSSLNTSEPFLRLLSVILGVATIVVVMIWLKPISPSASLLAGLLCATMPILLRYSQEIQSYPLLLLSLTFSFYFVHRISSGRTSTPWYIALIIALSITVATHMIGILTTASICIYALPALLSRRNAFQRGKLTLSILMPAVVFGLTYFFFTEGGKASRWMSPLSVDLVVSQFKYVFGVQALFAPIGILSRHSSVWALSYDYAIKIILVVCCGCLVLGNWRRNWTLLGAAGAYWAQIAAFSLVLFPIFIYRTILPGFIPLVSFVGLQAASIQKRNIRLMTIAGLSLVGLLLATGWIMTEARVPKEHWKQLAQYLELEYQPGNLVAFYPSYTERPVRYYFSALPAENTIAVDLGTGIKEIDTKLAKGMKQSSEDNAPAVLFLVVRPDLSVEQDNATYRTLLACLESSAVHTSPPRDFGGLLVLRYELQR
jgi:hypothetical protein